MIQKSLNIDKLVRTPLWKLNKFKIARVVSLNRPLSTKVPIPELISNSNLISSSRSKSERIPCFELPSHRSYSTHEPFTSQCEILDVSLLPPRSTPEYTPISSKHSYSPQPQSQSLFQNPEQNDAKNVDNVKQGFQFPSQSAAPTYSSLYSLRWAESTGPRNLLLVKKPWQPHVRQAMVDFIKYESNIY